MAKLSSLIRAACLISDWHADLAAGRQDRLLYYAFDLL